MTRPFWGRLAFAGFLLFPFLFLLAQFPGLGRLDLDEILWAAGNSFWQAFFSATLSLVLGVWGAAGLLCFSSGLRRRWRALLEVLLLTPNFLPPIFTLLALLNLVDPFPMGRLGIVLVHVALNWGLVAVLLAGLIESKAGAVAELAWLEGVTRRRFVARILFPMLRKDLALMWVFVFALCFASFAVPLVVGGGRGTTLEVLIYERIRLSTDWSQAVAIAALQSIFLFGLAWVAARGRATAVSRKANLSLFCSRTGLLPILASTALLGLGYLQGLPAGFAQLGEFFVLSGDVGWSLLGSLWTGLATGALCLGLLFATAALVPSPWFEKFLAGFSAPSQALTAFAFLVLSPNEGAWPFVKLPLAFALLSFPLMWRMGWQGSLDSLNRQRAVALTLGIEGRAFLRQIAIPQLASRASTLAGLAAVWATGDFAVSRILAHRDLTLAMMTETLMTGYRLNLATVLSLGLFAVAAVVFLVLKGAGRVLGRRPLS